MDPVAKSIRRNRQKEFKRLMSDARNPTRFPTASYPPAASPRKSSQSPSL